MLIFKKFRKNIIKFGLRLIEKNVIQKFDCRLKGEKQIVIHSNRPSPAPSLAIMVSLLGSPLSIEQVAIIFFYIDF
jgi:hypothetical protein